MSLLEKILRAKQEEVILLEKDAYFLEKKQAPDNRILKFEQALRRKNKGPPQIIAESKKASPSRGLLSKEYDPEKIAAAYKNCGAAAVSVLTDTNFFQGSIKHLALARKCGLPILRKDFIISSLQIRQSKHAGADAVLLIARLLSPGKLKEFYSLAEKIGLGVLVEVHNEHEAERAIELQARVIGMNHRDLETLKMDTSLSLRLAPMLRQALPHSILVAESGMETRSDIEKIQEHADALLIGTSLMESPNIPKRWQELFE